MNPSAHHTTPFLQDPPTLLSPSSTPTPASGPQRRPHSLQARKPSIPPTHSLFHPSHFLGSLRNLLLERWPLCVEEQDGPSPKSKLTLVQQGSLPLRGEPGCTVRPATRPGHAQSCPWSWLPWSREEEGQTLPKAGQKPFCVVGSSPPESGLGR